LPVGSGILIAMQTAATPAVILPLVLIGIVALLFLPWAETIVLLVAGFLLVVGLLARGTARAEALRQPAKGEHYVGGQGPMLSEGEPRSPGGGD
jgi:hypothetical protein